MRHNEDRKKLEELKSRPKESLSKEDAKILEKHKNAQLRHNE